MKMVTFVQVCVEKGMGGGGGPEVFIYGQSLKQFPHTFVMVYI